MLVLGSLGRCFRIGFQGFVALELQTGSVFMSGFRVKGSLLYSLGEKVKGIGFGRTLGFLALTLSPRLELHFPRFPHSCPCPESTIPL